MTTVAEGAPRWRWILWALVLLGAAGVLAFALARAVYPLRFRELIETEAARHGFDPLLLAAVVYVESRFDPYAVSSRGARGLMQVMPETGAWAAGRMGLGTLDPDDLFLPQVNLRVGTWYLAELRRRFDGDPVLMLAAYNAGLARVQAWQRGGLLAQRGLDASERAAAIPFPETRAFVLKVLRTYDIYRWLYRPWGRLAP